MSIPGIVKRKDSAIRSRNLALRLTFAQKKDAAKLKSQQRSNQFRVKVVHPATSSSATRRRPSNIETQCGTFSCMRALLRGPGLDACASPPIEGLS